MENIYKNMPTNKKAEEATLISDSILQNQEYYWGKKRYFMMMVISPKGYNNSKCRALI